MKKIIAVIVAVAFLCMSCGQNKVIEGKERKPVGIVSMCADFGDYSKKIHYEPCWGNIVWGVLLSETVIAPIYFFGFSMFNPVSVKDTTSN